MKECKIPMSSFKFHSLGGFLLRKKQAFQGSAIASFLRYASELATPALTILATTKGRGRPCASSRTSK